MVALSQVVDHTNALKTNAFQGTMQRKAVKLSTLLFLAALAGCTTTKGSFCQIASPIRPANVDVLTDAEVAAILAHNSKGERLCRWKP